MVHSSRLKYKERKYRMLWDPILVFGFIFIIFFLLHNEMIFFIRENRHDWSNWAKTLCTFICDLFYFCVIPLMFMF